MLGLQRPPEFKHVEMTDEIGLRISTGILDRIADPGLRTQVNDAVYATARHRAVERDMVGEIGFQELKRRAEPSFEIGDPIPLQLHHIIVVQIVDPDDLIAPRQQRGGGMESDEARGPGDQDGRHSGDLLCPYGGAVKRISFTEGQHACRDFTFRCRSMANR